MSVNIAIIDYGMGNLRSVQKGFEKVGISAVITGDPETVASAAAVVLPGVGAFGDAVDHLRRSGLAEATLAALASGRPFLGICLGLQLLFERSSEDGDHTGLGFFSGTVERLPDKVKVPHMGWNQAELTQELPLFDGVASGTDFYFVHSYAVCPTDPAIVASVTDYGGQFVSGVAAGNVFAFQFHPEKSGTVGLKVLHNFGRLAG